MSEEDKIIYGLLRQTVENTQNLPRINDDIITLINANQITNGKLFEEVIQAIKDGETIETTLRKFVLDNAAVGTLQISTQFIKYFSEITGIGMHKLLEQPYKKGGTRKRSQIKRKQSQIRRKRSQIRRKQSQIKRKQSQTKKYRRF